MFTLTIVKCLTIVTMSAIVKCFVRRYLLRIFFFARVCRFDRFGLSGTGVCVHKTIAFERNIIFRLSNVLTRCKPTRLLQVIVLVKNVYVWSTKKRRAAKKRQTLPPRVWNDYLISRLWKDKKTKNRISRQEDTSRPWNIM